MSRLICCLTFLFVVSACSNKKEEKREPIIPVVNEYPDLQLNLKNGEKLSAKELKGDNVFVFFQPDCKHCQLEAVAIEQHLEEFKDYTLYFISSSSMEAIQIFAESFDLDGLENVKFARTSTESVLTYYGPIPTPSVYVYSNGKLKKSFNGQTEVETIISAL
jgi:thiol-disulfide isomerase/thioredoxin